MLFASENANVRSVSLLLLGGCLEMQLALSPAKFWVHAVRLRAQRGTMEAVTLAHRIAGIGQATQETVNLLLLDSEKKGI